MRVRGEKGAGRGSSFRVSPAWPRPCTPAAERAAPGPDPPPAARSEGRGWPGHPRPHRPPRPGSRLPLAGCARHPAPDGRGPMNAWLSARQPRRLGGWAPERWWRSQQPGALTERPVGGIPAPRSSARPARPGPQRAWARRPCAGTCACCSPWARAGGWRGAAGSQVSPDLGGGGRGAAAAAGSRAAPCAAWSGGPQPARFRAGSHRFAK